MITCLVIYRIDPYQVAAFEAYCRTWYALIERMGGRQHGYLLPDEGPNDLAISSFSFDSLAEYERYRTALKADPDCQEALDFANRTGCILRYDRHFMRPVMEGDAEALKRFEAGEGGGGLRM